MRLRAIFPLLALSLATTACGRDDAPAAGAPDTAASRASASADAGRPDPHMKVTVDTQRVEPTGADSTVAPDAGD